MSVGVQCERVCLCKHCEGRGSRVEGRRTNVLFPVYVAIRVPLASNSTRCMQLILSSQLLQCWNYLSNR